MLTTPVPAILMALSLVGTPPADSPEQLRDRAMAAIKQNCSALTRCRLVWTHRVIEDGFTPDREVTVTRRHQMWFDGGERIATLWDGAELFAGEDESTVRPAAGGRRATFHKGEFRSRQTAPDSRRVSVLDKPAFVAYENWLDNIKWGSGGRLELWKRGRLRSAIDAAVESVDGDAILTVTLKRPNNGYREVNTYNLSRGGLLQEVRSFDPDGQIASTTEHQLELVDRGLWMPVRVVNRVFEPETGRITLLHEYMLARAHCAFNDAAEIPADAFEIPITPDLIVGDGRGTEAVSYTGVTQPVARDVLSELIKLQRARGDGPVFRLTRDGMIPPEIMPPQSAL